MSEESSGKLTKLIIESYADGEYSQKGGEPFTAMFNPNKYSLKYEIEYGERQAPGTTANAPSFSNMKSQELSLEFFLDGTGVATGKKEDVEKKVDEFLKTCYEYQGDIHRNYYLRVSWSYLVFDCVLQSVDINYNLFESSGKPLRAKMNAKFLGFVNDRLREERMNKSSPDLSHLRTVKGRERIDSMTFQMYKTTAYYIDVAKANGLVNFRKLTAGDQLVFPPVVKVVKEETG